MQKHREMRNPSRAGSIRLQDNAGAFQQDDKEGGGAGR